MKIAILGYYGHKNAGDEAFKDVFKRYLTEHNIEFYSPSTLPLFDPSYECLILGGGNVLGSYFLLPILERGWLNVPRKYAIGVGLSDAYGLEKIGDFNFNLLAIRNKSEFDKLSKFNYACFVPDLVFSQYGSFNQTRFSSGITLVDSQVEKKRSIAIIPSLEYFPEHFGTFSDSTYKDFDTSIKNLSTFVQEIIHDWNINLFAISSDPYHYDEIYSRLLYRACPDAWRNVNVINTHGDPIKTIELLSENEIVMSMKYHGLVFGLLNNSKIINISRNIKNIDLMESLFLSDHTFDLSIASNESKKIIQSVYSDTYQPLESKIKIFADSVDDFMKNFKETLNSCKEKQ